MRMLIVLVVAFVQTLIVRATFDDVEMKLAYYDARFKQLEKERHVEKEIIQMLKLQGTQFEKQRNEDKETIKLLKLQISQLKKEQHEDKEQFKILKLQTTKLEQFQRQAVVGKYLQSSFVKSPHTRVPGFAPSAFTACVQGFDTNFGNHQTIIFEKVITNVGNAYNPNNGEFTAPISGVYAFHVSLMVFYQSETYFQIVKDGQLIDDMYVDGHSTNELTTGGEFWVLQLNAGSQVWIRTGRAGDRMHGNCHTMFSGFFLFEV
ncbi:complement C1q tumor necrosis factor-related protein 3-like [Dreissena polymorpha]|uniref:C1q domain-containing protein n=1 Tax=Dreissena polymorpha TaxID=45954 RepID=A0A9D4CSH3_DREPO|nr:complement C1q tumor necrosis factor-related protein 3-like [Dreissena polymorpha]KAH3730427.1 hypothetical protein DPMN_056413 [Dreissena polymorpha]